MQRKFWDWFFGLFVSSWKKDFNKRVDDLVASHARASRRIYEESLPKIKEYNRKTNEQNVKKVKDVEDSIKSSMVLAVNELKIQKG